MGGIFDREAWLAFEKSFIAAFDDVTMTIFDQVQEGNKVATRFELGGRQVNEFAGVPSLGRTESLSATVVDVVEDGMIVEHWAEIGFDNFLARLRQPVTK